MNENKSPHFLIVGHEGCHNRGCEALVRSTINILKEQFVDARVTLASMYPEHETPLNDIPGLSIVPGFNKINKFSFDAVSRRVTAFSISELVKYFLPYGVVTTLKAHRRNWQKILSSPRPKTEKEFSQVWHLKRVMSEADAVISIGGDLFIEDYGPPVYAMESIEYAQFLGRKTVIWGASIWPLQTSWIEKRVKEMLLQTGLITVRDDPTMEYLSSLGVKKNVVRVADGAFLMQSRLSERTQLPWHSRPSRVIGFNGSDIIHYYLSRGRSQNAIVDIMKFFQVLIDKQGCSLVFVPHDGFPGAGERDFLFGFEQMINRADKVYMIPIGLDARETKAVIGQCDIFISMRFHPSIASLSQGIPTLGLSHSAKFAGLHEAIFGHRNYLIPYENISFELLMQKFREIWNAKDKIRKQLGKKVPEFQAQARLGGKYIKKLLCNDLERKYT